MPEIQELPPGWSRPRLGELLRRRTERASGKEPLLSVTQARGVISQTEVGRRDSSSDEKGSYWRVHPGDIVYNTMRMWQGVSGRSNLFGIVSPAYTVCEPSKKADTRFLSHLFKRPDSIAEFCRLSQGLVSDTWNLKYPSFAAIRFAIPPKAEQRKIAEILDALDNQLLTQKRLVKKLQVRREGIVENLLKQLVADQSPLGSHLTQSPKNGYSPKEIDEWTGFQALGLGCLTPAGFEPRQLKNIPQRDGRHSAALLTEGDLLMSRANTRDLVGLAGIYRHVGTPCIYPDLMMRLTPKSECRAKFLELVLRSASVRQQIQAIAQGTSESMVKISGSSVQKLLVRIPNIQEQDQLIAAVAALSREIDTYLKEQEKTAALKQGLMEDLMAGRARIREAESEVQDF